MENDPFAAAPHSEVNSEDDYWVNRVKFENFLIARGVSFSIDEPAAETDQEIEEDIRRRRAHYLGELGLGEEVSAEVAATISQLVEKDLINEVVTKIEGNVKQAKKLFTLDLLARLKTVSDKYRRLGKSVAYKKDLQAMVLADSMDDAWRELIDQEFDGEPLSDEEGPAYAELLKGEVARHEQIRAEEIMLVFIGMSENYLLNSGELELEEGTKHLIGRLARLKVNYRYLSDRMDLGVSLRQEAHQLLAASGLVNAAWLKLVDTFFPI